MSENSPVQLVTGKTDVEKAHGIRDRLVDAMKPLIAVMDEAAAEGFIINWNINNAMGKHFLAQVSINKDLLK